MSKEEIYNIITDERIFQDKRWGGKKHDEIHSLAEWYEIMRLYLDDADVADARGKKDDSLDSLRKLLAVGVACAEVWGLKER